MQHQNERETDDIEQCPECDLSDEQLNGEIACVNDSCEVGEYLPGGGVVTC